MRIFAALVAAALAVLVLGLSGVLLFGRGDAPALPALAAPGAASSAATIAGTVMLDAALGNDVAPGDTVYVFAKAPDGGGPPLAVKRFTAARFPLAFRLEDGDAIMPGRKLSAFGEVVLTARVSKSGNAIARPGDIASAPVRARPGAAGVTLLLGGR